MKLPLRYNKFYGRLTADDGLTIAILSNWDHAAEIVRAVNALPACVAAMEAVEMYVLRWSRGCEMDPLEMDEQAETLAQLRLALAAAKDGA